jgi:hypothetical protein
MTEGRGRGTSPATNTELRDVSNGSAPGNHVFDNCTGILLLAKHRQPVRGQPLPDLPTGRSVRLTRP